MYRAWPFIACLLVLGCPAERGDPRPLPGGKLPIPDRTVAEVRSSLPERPWDRERRYRGLGLDDATAARLAGAPWAALFDALDPVVKKWFVPQELYAEYHDPLSG